MKNILRTTELSYNQQVYNIHSFCKCVIMLLAVIMIQIWYHCRPKHEMHSTPGMPEWGAWRDHYLPCLWKGGTGIPT